jgi:hypothetical protein
VAAKSLKAGSLLGASMGTVILAGFSGPALGQSGEEACAFVLQLRSPYTVERVLEQFPNDPCIPVMLTTISPQLLARVSRAKVLALPASQLRRIPQEVLDQLGGGSSTRSLPGTTYNPPSSNSNNSNSGSQY